MNQVVRVFVERAQSRRLSLLELVSVVPDDSWSRRSMHEQWNAYRHLAHALTADDGVAAMIPAFAATNPTRLHVGELHEERENLIESVVHLELAALTELSVDARRRVLINLGALAQPDLEREIIFVDERSPWGQPRPGVVVPLPRTVGGSRCRPRECHSRRDSHFPGSFRSRPRAKKKLGRPPQRRGADPIFPGPLR